METTVFCGGEFDKYFFAKIKGPLKIYIMQGGGGGQTFSKVGPNWSSFIYYDPFTEHINTKIQSVISNQLSAKVFISLTLRL